MCSTFQKNSTTLYQGVKIIQSVHTVKLQIKKYVEVQKSKEIKQILIIIIMNI